MAFPAIEAVEKAAEFAKVQPTPKPEDGLLNVFAEGVVPYALR